MSSAFISSKNNVYVLPDQNGIRIAVKDNFELFFNATNGGEITEYFDLVVDPSRSRNLANMGWNPYYNLLPLFASLFYKPLYPESVFSTGGDASARLWLISNTSEYVILQSSSRIMSKLGEVGRDAHGNVIYVNSTWIIRPNGLFSVERTFAVPSYVTISSGWRWYPFYLTRRAGFGYDATFYMFNTTYAYSSVVNEATYRNIFGSYPLLPNDTRGVFGVALPFSNTSIGGDGTHNIIIVYKHDELLNANVWRTDNFHSERIGITESGAVYEFSKAVNVSTHTYHATINFTHQPINEESVKSFANDYANNTSVGLLIECSVITNKEVYKTGDYYAFYGSGISHYNLTLLTAKFTVKNSSNQIVYQRGYGPGNITAGQTFNFTLLAGTIKPDSVRDDYTLLLQLFSPYGIVIASSSKVITITTS